MTSSETSSERSSEKCSETSTETSRETNSETGNETSRAASSETSNGALSLILAVSTDLWSGTIRCVMRREKENLLGSHN